MKKIDKICPICSKNYSVPFCHKDRYLTCGYTCGGILRKKPIIINKCLYCNKNFSSKKHPTMTQKFCSRQCVAKSKINQIEFECRECKKIFTAVPSRVKEGKGRASFCSKSCQIINWNRNSIKAEMPGSYQRNAWRVYEKKCYDCELRDERILIIHHIDGNRKNGKLENLIPLCHNCHCIRHIEMSGNNRLPSYRGRD